VRSATAFLAVATLVVSACSPADSQVPRILTDGRFDEWGDVPPVIVDPADAPPDAAVDLRSALAADDPDFLHLALDVGRRVNAQSMRGTIRVLIDADGRPDTGAAVMQLKGVDLVVELSRMDAPRPGGYGAGVGIRGAEAGELGPLRRGYDADVVVAPTYSAPRFEMRVRRGVAIDGGPALLRGDSIVLQIVFTDVTGVRDSTTTGAYHFRTRVRAEPSRLEPVDLSKADGSVRIVQWNVASTDLGEGADRYRRVLAALAPDIMLLDELYGTVSDSTLDEFVGEEPLAHLGPWGFALGRTGGRQRSAVVAHLPIRPADQLLDVRYEAGALEALAADVHATAYARLFELESQRGLSTAGAWVTVGGREILFVPLDLQSAGYDGSVEDRLRELQAGTLNRRVTRVVAS
jgi:hypothetical protein